MDTSASNGYLLLKHGNETDLAHRDHRKYQETLTTELLTTPDDRPPQVVETIQTRPAAGQ